METLPARNWVAACSARLQQHWKTIDPQRLDDLAQDLARDDGVSEPEAFRDTALTDDFIWSDETQAIQCAVRLAHGTIRKEPHRLVADGASVT